MPQDSRPFKNSNLFSNHYLEKLVIDNPEWRKAEPKEAFASIKELYQRKARALENYNESQLEENFIRPVLRILGHYFGVQGKVAGKDRLLTMLFILMSRAWMKRRHVLARTTIAAP